MPLYLIEDDLHAENHGNFPTREQALAAMRRLATIPWNEHPNRAPCMSWQTCGRRYELREIDDTLSPSKVLSRGPWLEISADGVRWSAEEGGAGP